MNVVEFLLVLVLGAHPEAEAAVADMRGRGPVAYLSLSSVDEADSFKLERTLRFIVPSLSSRQLLTDQVPTRVTGTKLLRLDLAGLGWEQAYPRMLTRHYPYRPDLAGRAVPIVADGLWFAANAMDSGETGESQYELLYGISRPPKTVGEFLKFWGVQDDPDYVFGVIEGASGVAVQRQRLIENRPAAKRNYGWLTRDSRVVAGQNDPLENLPNTIKFDAQEIIVGVRKWSAGESGCLQAYFLANGKGERQERAPPDVVVDHVGVRGVEIRNTLSCITCHGLGINAPTSDQFRSYIESGAKVGFLDKARQRSVDQYLGSDVAKEVQSNRGEYADGVRLCNGLGPEENAAEFVKVVLLYDADVTLEQAARELYCTKRDLQLALADYSSRQTLTGRLALLAQGRAISRQQFKSSYRQAQEIVESWRSTSR